ncbi:Gfo/Idh/MocA family oxidoreductase [Gemmata sp. G18]|uniref:Gfo/Idh/MocA family oxidoreductase n=1 Tax=Gemmata palustris TaxID=2822762 RepID=A0ABS5C301_9BACT|nr:Gfo/Idh/MocA family oxidoreductase [Gemmata palustris]MBP3960359.1 Gfo/Idh/MocA family oxidoreductase [Gemmata palustris]
MAKYRVAVIGRTGKGAYGHGLDTVWLKCDKAEVVAVADENEAGRTAAAKRLNAKSAYADFRQMLEKERPQIVSVADRWPDCHRDMVLACAEYGANIFLEKPASQTLQQVDEMVAVCEKHHVKCAIAHQTAYSPRVKVVKDLIGEGKIGAVMELRGHGKEDKRGGGEDLMVLGTHTFDLMRHLAGDSKWCFARIQQAGRKAVSGDVRQGGEQIGPIVGDHITATYGFAGIALGHYVTHVAKDGASTRYWLEVRGTKGTIHLGFGILPAAYLCEDPSGMFGKSKAPWVEITSAGLGKPEPLNAKELDNGNILIVNDLIEAIEKDRAPLDSLSDGRAALEMIMAVYESHRLERPVDLPLKNRKHPLAAM